MIEFDYSSLIGFVYSNEKLRTKGGLAKYLGITHQAISNKFNGKVPFHSYEIMKIRIDFNLTDEQVGRYFFTPKLQKVNTGE